MKQAGWNIVQQSTLVWHLMQQLRRELSSSALGSDFYVAGGPDETRRLKYCSTINRLVWHVLQQLGRGLTSARNAKNFIQRRSSPLGNFPVLHTTHFVVHSLLHICPLLCTCNFVFYALNRYNMKLSNTASSALYWPGLSLGFDISLHHVELHQTWK